MNLVKIKTGANISNSLQSTLNYHQAFTELVKNAVQNGAHNIDIKVSTDKIVISDDGTGFNHEKDDEGLTGFEKYFIYGNSYKSTINAPQLGHMGIGGKISNDKLSQAGDVHWRIDTKNSSGSSFIFDYRPRKLEIHKKYDGHWYVLEEDGTPYTISQDCNTQRELTLTSEDIEQLKYIEGFEQVNDEFCKWDQTVYLNGFAPVVTESTETAVEYDTGTVITIFNIDSPLKKKIKKSWIDELHKTLNLFFGHLVASYKKQSRPFNININGTPVIFKYNLSGVSLGNITKKFKYNINGKRKESEFTIQLNIVHRRKFFRGSPIKDVSIISQVRVCNLRLDDEEVLERVFKTISEERGEEIPYKRSILTPYSKMIGFVTCDDLSSVLDSTGMPAKDISHHSLRDDHPLTLPFKFAVYYEICNILVDMHLTRRRNNKMQKDNNIIAFNVAKFISQEFSLSKNILASAKRLGLGEYFDISGAEIKKKPGYTTKLGAYGDGSDPEVLSERLYSLTDSKPRGRKRGGRRAKEETSPSQESPVSSSDVEKVSENLPEEISKKRSKGRRSKKPQHNPIGAFINKIVDAVSPITEESISKTTVPRRRSTRKTVKNKQTLVDTFRDRLVRQSIIDREISLIETQLKSKDITSVDKQELQKELELAIQKRESFLTDPDAIYLWHSLEPFGDNKLASEVREVEGNLCVCINTLNPKYMSFDKNNDTLGIALHMAECMIRELIQIEHEGITKELLDEKVSDFYAKHFPRLSNMNLMDVT